MTKKFCFDCKVKIVRKSLNEFIGQPYLFFQLNSFVLTAKPGAPSIFLLTSPHPQCTPPSQTIHCQLVLQKPAKAFFYCEKLIQIDLFSPPFIFHCLLFF